jgi:hypothetical protein
MKNSKRHSISLGSADSMTREQAQIELTRIIQQDERQCGIVKKLTAATKPMPQRTMNRHLPRHPALIGTAAELLVAMDLTMRGFEVYRAVSHTAPCDLIFCDDEGARIRVEVKSIEYRNERTPRVCLARNAGKFDVLAIVDREGRIHYRTHNGIGKSILLLPQDSDDFDQQLTRKV